MPSVYFNVKFVEANGISNKLFNAIMIMLSFGSSMLLLRYAMKSIPMSVAYSIWTAVGVLGAVLVGVMFRGETMDAKKLFFIAIIIFSAIMLKII